MSRNEPQNEPQNAAQPEPRVDPRVTRTKAQLRDALRELMTQRRWDKIRVQDILDITGISRSAFYSHYDGKYDLLTSGIPDTIIDIGSPDGDGIDLTPFFAHVDDMAAVMKPLMTQPILGDIMADFHRLLVAAWAEHLGLDDDNWVLPDMLAGALLAVAKSYVVQRSRPEPAVVAKQVELHVAALLAAAD